MTKDALTIDDLFSDSGIFDESAVVKAIQPFITVQKSTNEIYFKNSSPTAELRILIYCLAKKLLKTKGHIEDELITAQEIQQKTGIKKGTIDPTIKKLKETGFLLGKGKYEIPIPKIADAIERLTKLEKR